MLNKYKIIIRVALIIIISIIGFKYLRSMPELQMDDRIDHQKAEQNVEQNEENIAYQNYINNQVAKAKAIDNQKIDPIFDVDGIDDIALIMMIKNEDDIIFENLVWHFSIGFRKFVIVDNLSTDGTKEKLDKFIELTKNHAEVFIINDPIVEYIQSRITTGAYDFARSVWPELKWIFPVDADEFWTPRGRLKDALTNIPKIVDAIAAPKSIYVLAPDYYNFNKNEKFYKKIHYRTKNISLSEDVDYISKQAKAGEKVAIRSQSNILIHQGNHYIERINNYNHKELKYLDSGLIGIEMYEYPFRSVEQTHKKLFQGMKANMLAKEAKLISSSMGSHWDQYANYIKKYGDKAAEIKFKERFLIINGNSDNYSNDPMPIDKAIKIFHQIIQEDKK